MTQSEARDVMPGWPEAGFEARQLLRDARSASLATLGGGLPFVSLVTHAVDSDGAILMLLSGLSEHTRQLQAEPGCSLMVLGVSSGPNPQTTPRVTVTGAATPAPEPRLRARWIARHPYAGFYAGFADFALWRLVPQAGLIVAGFGRAARLEASALLPDQAIGQALAQRLPQLASAWQARPGAAGKLCGIDADGADIETKDGLRRLTFGHPATSADAAASLLMMAEPAG